jgi:hypothetical protein
VAAHLVPLMKDVRWAVHSLCLGCVLPEPHEKVGRERHVLVEQRRATAEFFRAIILQDRPDDCAFRKSRLGGSNRKQRRCSDAHAQSPKRLTARPIPRTKISTHLHRSTSPSERCLESVQRFHLHDRGAVIASGQKVDGVVELST